MFLQQNHNNEDEIPRLVMATLTQLLFLDVIYIYFFFSEFPLQELTLMFLISEAHPGRNCHTTNS